MNSILRKVEDLGFNASAGHSRKFWGCTLVQNWIRERKRHSGRVPKKVNFMSDILAGPVLRNNHLRKRHDKQIVPAKSRGIWREKSKLKSNIKLRFIFVWRRQRHRSAHVYLCIRELQCTMLSKEIWAQIQWILWGGPKLDMRLTVTGSSANKRVSTSSCSWSRSVRNSASTRWNASDSFAT